MASALERLIAADVARLKDEVKWSEGGHVWAFDVKRHHLVALSTVMDLLVVVLYLVHFFVDFPFDSV